MTTGSPGPMNKIGCTSTTDTSEIANSRKGTASSQSMSRARTVSTSFAEVACRQADDGADHDGERRSPPRRRTARSAPRRRSGPGCRGPGRRCRARTCRWARPAARSGSARSAAGARGTAGTPRARWPHAMTGAKIATATMRTMTDEGDHRGAVAAQPLTRPAAMGCGLRSSWPPRPRRPRRLISCPARLSWMLMVMLASQRSVQAQEPPTSPVSITRSSVPMLGRDFEMSSPSSTGKWQAARCAALVTEPWAQARVRRRRTAGCALGQRGWNRQPRRRVDRRRHVADQDDPLALPGAIRVGHRAPRTAARRCRGAEGAPRCCSTGACSRSSRGTSPRPVADVPDHRQVVGDEDVGQAELGSAGRRAG